MPSECQTVWIQIRPDDIVGPDLAPNCLLRLSADDTGRQRFKGVFPSQEHVHTEATKVCTLHIVKKKEIRAGIEIIKMIILGSFAPFLHKVISFMILQCIRIPSLRQFYKTWFYAELSYSRQKLSLSDLL